MIRYFSILILLLFNLSNVMAANLPVSARSVAAINAKAPSLQAEFEDKGLSLGAPVFMRVFKESNELEVWVKSGPSYRHFKTYPICYFSGLLGPKTRQGDHQAPEGFYTVRPSQLNPFSSYHLSFNVGYPNAFDRAHGRTGSAIMVHGKCVSVGCFAMNDDVIEEIYTIAHKALENGQSQFQFHIFPFRLTDANLLKHQNSEWMDFWKNLKTGYDLFERTNIPPVAFVQDKRYAFR